MKVRRNRSYWEFLAAPEDPAWRGMRIKQIRHRPLIPGGRAQLTMFEVSEGPRPHPRMRLTMPPASDPSPPGILFEPEHPPGDVAALRRLIRAALDQHKTVLSGDEVSADRAPKGSASYWRHSIRVQRIATFFAQVRAQLKRWLDAGQLTREQRKPALRAVREIEDQTYSTRIDFDDGDTGTYHSYGKDEPFVHYLEALLASLPAQGDEAFAVLSGHAQHAVRRQRDQLYKHLDHLMRHKYAYEVIVETDIERTLGGLLIDRDSRRIASEVPDNSSLVPRFELLRIDPGADHPHAGAWVYRDGVGGIHLQDGTAVQVARDLLRSIKRMPEQLTFLRAPGDPRLRRGIRFDWDGNGWVRDGAIDWVSWAGHCDIKAIMEQLGIVLTDDHELTEYRSDTETSTTYDRELLIEMIASAMELGSIYNRADGTGTLKRGIHRFGGSRNDSRPDRLQFKGFGQGRHFRWPLTGKQDAFQVTAITWPRDSSDGRTEPAGQDDDSGDDMVAADMGTVYFRHLPDIDAVDFHPNPRYIKTVEGDYNLIDVSGARITAKILADEFDPQSGYPQQTERTTTIDLRPNLPHKRYFLGTHIDDVAERRLYQVYLDRANNQIVAELYQYEKNDDRWQPRQLEDKTVTVPLVTPLTCTLSHEMKRDNPALYQSLLDVALRQAQNICADTDRKAPVWNGVVTSLDVGKVADNPDRRVERWLVSIKARFGEAELDYMLRRDEVGVPSEFCPVSSEQSRTEWPDFLWQDFPDVGSKGREGGEWIINRAMVDREIVSSRVEPSAPGGFYVYDDHIKNLFEIIFTALAGYRYSIIHDNKRYGFDSKEDWDMAIQVLKKRRRELTLRTD
ncbi:MAG: hypothetical protein AAGC55_00155 [Myxococcota bacterium]